MRIRTRGIRVGLLVLAATWCGLAAPAVAPALASPAPAPTGYDVSYPQCGERLPAASHFAVVGTGDGIVLSTNPCLAAEYAWARSAAAVPAFYANTGDPGLAHSTHWPTGQTTPEACLGTNSSGCSYDYGWNAATSSYANATTVAGAPAAAAASWWLDVETGNSWQALESGYGATATSQGNDVAELAGEVGYLNSVGVRSVGIYSSVGQWKDITGGGGLTNLPVWLAGAGNAQQAGAGCTPAASFTGGPVELSQFRSTGFDGDVACA